MRAVITRNRLALAARLLAVVILAVGLGGCSRDTATTTSAAAASSSTVGSTSATSATSLPVGTVTSTTAVAALDTTTSVSLPDSTTVSEATTTTVKATTTSAKATTTTAVVTTTTTTAPVTTTTTAASTTTTSAATSSTMTTVANYSMTVKGAFGTKTYSIGDLHAFPQVSETIQDKPASGPQLLVVLTDAGVTDFTKITAYGLRGGTDVLTKAQASASEVLLSFTQRGTVKLVSNIYTSDFWTKDVTLIVVE